MSMTDLRNNGSAAPTSKAPAKASTARKTTAAPTKTDDVPTVGYAVLNGGGQKWLVVGGDEIRKGRTVKARSNAGKEKLVVVGDTFKFGGKVYGEYSKAA